MDQERGNKRLPVKYDNAFNKASLGGLSATASNLLMLIARNVRDKGSQEIRFSDDELSQDFLIGHRKIDDVIRALTSISLSLLKIAAPIREGTKIKVQSVFREFIIEDAEEYQKSRLVVKVNDEYLFLFNELADNFTTFQLQEFASLRTTRAKTLYRLLKQFRTQGWLYLKVDDVLKLFFKFDTMSDFETVAYYRNNRRFIKPQVLSAATKECSRYFSDLQLETMKEKKRKGQPIVGYRWTFAAEKAVNYKKDDVKQEKRSIKEKSRLDQYNSFNQRKYDNDELERLLANSPNN